MHPGRAFRAVLLMAALAVTFFVLSSGSAFAPTFPSVPAIRDATVTPPPNVAAHLGFAVKGTASATSPGFVPNGGDTIVVFVAVYWKNTVKSVTDTAGNQFHSLAHVLQHSSSGFIGLAMWNATGVASVPSDAVTVTLQGTATDSAAVAIVDVTGVGPAPLDVTGKQTNSTMAGTTNRTFTNNLTTLTSNDLVLTMVAAKNKENWSASGVDQLIQNQQAATVGAPMTVADFQYTAPSPRSVSMSGTTTVSSTTWIADSLALKPSSTSSTKYPVTFNETGLPPSTTWSVTFGTTSNTTTAPHSIGFVAANGTYVFSVGAVAGFVAQPGSGRLTVNGGPASQRVAFQPKYPVTFDETGLVAGTSWTVSLNGSSSSAVAPGSIAFAEPNGTYPFQVSPVAGFVSNPTTGNVAVHGGPANASVKFTPGVLHIQHVVLIVLENRELSQIRTGGPYEHYLVNTYGNASQFFASCHSSTSQYMAMTSGRNFGCTSIGLESVPNIADLIEQHGLTWMGYMESLVGTCGKTAQGTYAPDHNPFVHYTDIRNNATRCATHVVNSGSFNQSVAAGTLPTFSFYTPNILDDCHNSTLSFCDAWLKQFLGPILNHTGADASSAERNLVNHTAFFIGYDEGTSRKGYLLTNLVNQGCVNQTGTNLTACGGHILMTVVSAFSPGKHFNSDATTYQIESTIEWLFSLGNDGGLDGNPSFPPMTSLFSFTTNSS